MKVVFLPWWNPNDESFSTIIEDYHDQCGSSDEEEDEDDCEVGEGSSLSETLQIYFDLGLVVNHNGDVVGYPSDIDNWIIGWGSGSSEECISLRQGLEPFSENMTTQWSIQGSQGLAAFHFYQSADGGWGEMDQEFYDIWLGSAIPGEYFCLNPEASEIMQQQFMGDAIQQLPAIALACARECSPQPSNSSISPYLLAEEMEAMLCWPMWLFG